MENGAIGKLLNLVESGNIYANELCYQLYPLFRSHGHVEILEYFNIYLGKLIKKDTEAFLILLGKYINRPESDYFHVDKVLCALGDTYVDRFDEQMRETEERIVALKNVQNEDLKETKEQCIEILSNERDFLLKIIKRMKDKEEKKE